MQSLEKLRPLVVATPFYASLRVDGLQPGEHPSDFEGQGGEYIGFPDLEDGEPMSAVNWRLSARSPGHFVKTEWESEKGIKVHVLVDVSDDMDFGSQWLTMRQLASVIAGSLFASAGTTGDYGRFMTYSSKGLGKILPVSGDWHAARLVHPSMAAILQGKATGATATGGIAQALRRIPYHPKTLVCIIGRFDNLSKEDEAALASSRKIQKVCIVVQDPRERDLRSREDAALPWYLRWLKIIPGVQEVEGANGEQVAVHANERSSILYAEAFRLREQKLHSLFARTGCKWCTFLTAATTEELEDLLGADGEFQGHRLPEDVCKRLFGSVIPKPLSASQCQRLLNDEAALELLNAYVLRRRLLRVLKCQRKSGCLDGRDFSEKNANPQPQPAATAAH